jgi:ABC-type Fe3+ transport system permease subunit
VGIAALLAVPSLAVLASLAHPAHEIWAHLWRTQLPELISNTLALVAVSAPARSSWAPGSRG